MKKIVLAFLILGVFVQTGFAESVKTYYPNGQVQIESSDTETKMYYENGQLSMQSYLKDGAPTGITKMYYQDGKLMREEDHAAGTWKQYGIDGKIQAEGTL